MGKLNFCSRVSECGVTANIPVLGTGDSGFESRHSDKKINMGNKHNKLLDKFDGSIRRHLSRHPILYTFIGGIAIVLFWRGVWHTADILQGFGGFLGVFFYEPINLIFATVILLVTGLFFSFFIGDNILMSGLRGEKALYRKTEKEVKESEVTLTDIKREVDKIKVEVDDIERKVKL